MCQDQGGRYVSLASSRDSGRGHSDEPVVSAKFRGGNPSKRTGRHPLALERDNPIEKVRVNRTARSLTSAPGPTLPTRALRQVGSYQGYTGRPANVVSTAAHVTQTGPQGCCEHGGALPNISYLSRHSPRISSTIDSVTSNRAKPVDVVHQLADVSDLVLVYRVPHTGIDTLRDDCIRSEERRV